MRVWRALIRVSLRSHFGISVIKDRYLVRRERLWELLLVLFFLLCLLPLGSLLFFFYTGTLWGIEMGGADECISDFTSGGGSGGGFHFGLLPDYRYTLLRQGSRGPVLAPGHPCPKCSVRGWLVSGSKWYSS